MPNGNIHRQHDTQGHIALFVGRFHVGIDQHVERHVKMTHFSA